MRAAALTVLGTVVLAARLCGQQRKTCLMVLDNADRQMTTNSLLPGNTIVDVAGNVRMHCDKQKVSLRTDSLSMLSGDYARLYGHAVYQDSSYQFAADTIIYLTRAEKVEGRGHVVALDKTTGSTLVGPFVDYWRQVKGINDSAKVVALLRPTVRYFVRTTPKDTAREQPYLLSGQMLQGFGGSRLWGSGAVTVDRDSLHGTGDSLAFQRGATSVAQLIGVPATLAPKRLRFIHGDGWRNPAGPGGRQAAGSARLRERPCHPRTIRHHGRHRSPVVCRRKTLPHAGVGQEEWGDAP